MIYVVSLHMKQYVICRNETHACICSVIKTPSGYNTTVVEGSWSNDHMIMSVTMVIANLETNIYSLSNFTSNCNKQTKNTRKLCAFQC